MTLAMKTPKQRIAKERPRGPTLTEAVRAIMESFANGASCRPIFFRNGVASLQSRQIDRRRLQTVLVITRLVLSKQDVIRLLQEKLKLSSKQASVAYLIAAGEPTQTIAALSAVTSNTVKRHTEATYLKLGVRSRAELELKLARLVMPLLS